MLERVKEYLPLFSVVFFFVSMARQILFYSFFGIKITSYIDFTEAITLSFPIFALLGISSLIGIIIGALLAKSFSAKTRSGDPPANTTLGRLKQNTSTSGYYGLVYYIPFLLSLDVGMLWYKDRLYKFPYTIFLLIVYLLVAYSEEIDAEIEFRTGELFKNKTHYIGWYRMAVAGLIITLGSAVTDALNIIYIPGIYLTQARVEFAGKTVYTSNNIRYVGKTKNYVFFYNKATGFTSSIPLSEVKMFTLKTRDVDYRATSRQMALPRN